MKTSQENISLTLAFCLFIALLVHILSWGF